MIDISTRKGPRKLVGYKTGKASNTGLVRVYNEDSLTTLESYIEDGTKIKFWGIYALADGVGGHEDGEIASSLAVRLFAKSLIETLLLSGLRLNNTTFSKESVRQALIKAVAIANRMIYTRGQTKSCRMGTTLAALLIINSTAYIVNVGDSRVYIREKKQFRQITKDDSLVAKLVDAGEITPEEIYSHPQRNIITHCLGTQKDLLVRPSVQKLKSGNSLLLCSDGLWEMVRDNEIKDIIAKNHNPQTACKRLIQAAIEGGGSDNISVILVKVT